MVDLAGSERLDSNDTTSPDKPDLRKKEGSKINKSLLSLTNCIITLGEQRTYTNFRDSKLTRILKSSLSGNSQMIMIGCISRGSDEYENSLNTLGYCSKAANIQKKVRANIEHKSQREVEAILLKARSQATSVSARISPSRSDRGSQAMNPQQALFEEARSILRRGDQDNHSLIEIMRKMVYMKQKIEEDYRRNKLGSADYFFSMQHYNELTLKILQTLEAKDSTAAESGMTKSNVKQSLTRFSAQNRSQEVQEDRTDLKTHGSLERKVFPVASKSVKIN